MNRVEIETKKFEELGIPIGHKFEIRELRGVYQVDVVNRVAFDMSPGCKILQSTSIYEHLLDGTWHKDSL